MSDAATHERRTLKFSCQNCIIGDIDKLMRGSVRSSGNWPPARIVQHIAVMIDGSIDGFPGEIKAPFPIRIAARLMKKKILRDPWKPGIRLPAKTEQALAPDDVSLEQAVENLRRAVGRLDSEEMAADSPILGKMTHDEWMKLHCRHAELHFSFLHPDDSP